MLIALLKGQAFHGVDEILLDQIIDIGRQSEELIYEKVGLVDDADLQSMLWRLATHFRIFHLAKEGRLAGAGDEFSKFTFPYQIDDRIPAKANALNARLKELKKIE